MEIKKMSCIFINNCHKIYFIMKKRAHKSNKIIVLLLGFICALIISIISFSAISYAQNEHETKIYYTNIYINQGDNIWNIAKENYSVEYGDFSKYVEEIKSLNHISNDLIHTGSYLIIPYCK